MFRWCVFIRSVSVKLISYFNYSTNSVINTVAVYHDLLWRNQTLNFPSMVHLHTEVDQIPNSTNFTHQRLQRGLCEYGCIHKIWCIKYSLAPKEAVWNLMSCLERVRAAVAAASTHTSDQSVSSRVKCWVKSTAALNQRPFWCTEREMITSDSSYEGNESTVIAIELFPRRYRCKSSYRGVFFKWWDGW